ncbi:MAG: GNAT family N-acetyltransferase [Fimbriimonadaceae bacterium]
MIFETDRLIARNWNPETDAEHAFEMYRNPNVTRYLGRGVPEKETTLEEQREKLITLNEKYAAFANGSGFWALELKEDPTEVVGAVIVKRLPDEIGDQTDEWEVGWHLKQKHWGKGYATESGLAAIEHAFRVIGLDEIYAIVYPENLPSIAVTKRLGMNPLGITHKYYGVTAELFHKSRDN